MLNSRVEKLKQADAKAEKVRSNARHLKAINDAKLFDVEAGGEIDANIVSFVCLSVVCFVVFVLFLLCVFCRDIIPYLPGESFDLLRWWYCTLEL